MTIVASGPAVTVTVAVAAIPPLTALTVFVKVAGEVPAVNRPELLMVPPPLSTDQVGEIVTVAPEKSLPTAVNCCVAPLTSVTGFGATTIVDREPGPLIPCTSHAPTSSPDSATAPISRATGTRRDSAAKVRLLIRLGIEIPLT